MECLHRETRISLSLRRHCEGGVSACRRRFGWWCTRKRWVSMADARQWRAGCGRLSQVSPRPLPCLGGVARDGSWVLHVCARILRPKCPLRSSSLLPSVRIISGFFGSFSLLLCDVASHGAHCCLVREFSQLIHPLFCRVVRAHPVSVALGPVLLRKSLGTHLDKMTNFLFCRHHRLAPVCVPPSAGLCASHIPVPSSQARNHSKNHWWRSLEEMRISRSGSHSLFLSLSTHTSRRPSVCPSNWLSCALCWQPSVNFVIFSFACPRNSLLAAYCVMSDSFCMCYGGP